MSPPLKARSTHAGTPSAFSGEVAKAPRRLIATITLALCVLAQEVLGAEAGVTIRYDPKKPDEATSIFWLAYLVARTAYHEKHNLSFPAPGEIIGTFAEEVYGRRMAVSAYRDLIKEPKKGRDPYWDAMARVEDAGFLEAYVWTFHRNRKWPAAPAPSNLRAFEVWQRTALRGHQPQTYGWLEMNRG